MRVGFIKYLVIKVMWLLLLAVAWFGITGGITTLVEFYEMKVSIGQITQDDTAYLLYRSMVGIKSAIHYVFTILTIAYLAVTALNIYQKIKIEGEVKK